MVTVHWFRQDLRLADNPALFAAAARGQVLPLFILDDHNAGDWSAGRASRWWLHHSLKQLDQSLHGHLLVRSGDARVVLDEVVRKYKASAVYWNRCYEPWRIQRDTQIKQDLEEAGITAKSFNGALLWEPWSVLKKDGTPYKVFTPYYRKGCLSAEPPRKPFPVPPQLDLLATRARSGVDSLGLLPKRGMVGQPAIRWDKRLAEHRSKHGLGIGEAAAAARLQGFLDDALAGYQVGRDFPARSHCSQLSAHLHFGEISPNQVWYAPFTEVDDDLDCFHSELGWREFSNYLLYHFPALPDDNFQPKFDPFPWQDDLAIRKRWQQGMTGIPMVDAGMRELLQTGFMHNRVRMITGSFLVKNLRQHWRHGERWFWDCLVDADLASNAASWQWVAGSGADAAPYFRIFNPVTQGKRFDPDGEYIRHYVPELTRLPNRWLFAPWEAPEQVLHEAGINLGEDYPLPVVDLRQSREQALSAWKML